MATRMLNLLRRYARGDVEAARANLQRACCTAGAAAADDLATTCHRPAEAERCAG